MGSEERTSKTVEEYIEILANVESLRKERNGSLSRMFWELRGLNVDEFEDGETKYQKIVPEKRTYSSTFMASSLGFNKSTIQAKYTEFLQRFHLERRPRVATLRNALHFEKLKFLIIKYFELIRR
ncbi:hypothetical protein PAPHI01_0931 [Pancytospora philotis]|nr:hypothetical protein PAPHI01_0931 [Pancytospora philotis]